jgi:FAD/FMN-containing dehydrogenase
MEDWVPNADRRSVVTGLAGLAAASLFPLGGCSKFGTLPTLELDGRVITPAHGDYEAWRTGVVWQARKPGRHPAMIVRPNSTEAVSEAVNYARANGLKVSVKSSGHNLWGNFLRDDGMLIDMWNFRKVEMEGDAAWVEPSVWSRDIMLELGKHGAAFPASHCASVGMGGFLLGGGVGLNCLEWGGLSTYNILAAEVVTADGKIRTIDDANDSDLAWALRGAGNGFPGIVTRFKLKTFPAPTALKAGTYIFPIDQTPAAMAWVDAMVERGMLKDCEPLVILGHSPMAQPDAPPEKAKVCIVRINVFATDVSAADSQLAAIAADPGAKAAVFAKVNEDWTFEQSYYGTLDYKNPLNYGYFGVDSVWVDSPEAALPVLAREFVKAPFPGCHVVMSPIGRVAQPVNSAAKVHGRLYVGIYAVGSSAADGEKAIAWLRETARAMEPHARGRYINEVDGEAAAGRVASCFTSQDWNRVGEVRKKYDPTGLFSDYFAAS